MSGTIGGAHAGRSNLRRSEGKNSMRRPIDFWFSIGSTYTFLSVMRLEAAQRQNDVNFNCRPFDIGVLLVEQNNIPFRGKPVKLAYMWRDIERRARARGRSVTVPVPYPLECYDLANQVAVLAAREGWCLEFAKVFYKRWFEDLAGAREPNVPEVVSSTGHDPGRVIRAAQSERVIRALQQATDEARKIGVFGAPSFVVDDEVFWGDDRMEDAIAWRKSRP
jgi:2-hydroxychromene-2-carboxylate isomerase